MRAQRAGSDQTERGAVAVSPYGRFLVLLAPYVSHDSAAMVRAVIEGTSRKALYVAREHGAVLAGTEVDAALANRQAGEIVEFSIQHARSIAPTGFPQRELRLSQALDGVLTEEQARHAILFVREADESGVRDERLRILAKLVSSRIDVPQGVRAT